MGMKVFRRCLRNNNTLIASARNLSDPDRPNREALIEEVREKHQPARHHSTYLLHERSMCCKYVARGPLLVRDEGVLGRALPFA